MSNYIEGTVENVKKYVKNYRKVIIYGKICIQKNNYEQNDKQKKWASLKNHLKNIKNKTLQLLML